MLAVFVTEPTRHESMFWLNFFALKNMCCMDVAEFICHESIFWLNADALLNM